MLIHISKETFDNLEASVRSAEARAMEAEADLASFIGESPLWISLDGFNLVYEREQAWKAAAMEAQAYLTVLSPAWQAIEDLRTGKKRDKAISAH